MLYHLEDIEKIRKIEDCVSRKGSTVFDISHWDSGSEYNKNMLSTLKIDTMDNPFKYIYSYEIPTSTHNSVKSLLMDKEYADIYSVFFPSSTLAIVNIANFLQKQKINRICVLQPAYFTVEPCLSAFGLIVESLSILFDDNGFRIPLETILSGKYDAVWITSPIFCTSTYYNYEEIVKLQLLLERKIFLICDESLSIPKYNLRNKLPNSEKLITIHSPHKIISTNALKFSCVLCHSRYKVFFDQWIDLFCGGLPSSSIIALRHFLSANYLECLNLHLEYTRTIKQHIINILNKSSSKISYIHTIGQYMTILCPMVTFEESKKLEFIKRIILNTHVSLLPGYLEGFYEKFGFCFRINLTLNKTPLLSSIHKVLYYLDKNYS